MCCGGFESKLMLLSNIHRSSRGIRFVPSRRQGSKETGKERPLGRPVLEDELVQLACAKLLAAIYEQDFLALRLPART
jgi:retron-type reverse transcriptase